MKKFEGVAAAAAGVLMLAGCGDSEEQATSSTSSATDTPSGVSSEELGEVGTLLELRDAAVEAGYDCPNWTQSNQVRLAAESGYCSDMDVFSTYLSSDVVQEVVQSLKEGSLGMRESVEERGGDPSTLSTTTLLVGPNWVINSPGAEDLQPQLGGSVASW